MRSYKLCIFKDDELFLDLDDGTLDLDYHGDPPIPAGEYVVAMCVVDAVGGDYIAFKSVLAAKVVVHQPVSRRAFHEAVSGDRDSQHPASVEGLERVSSTEMRLDLLSEHQRRATAETMKRQYPSSWKHAAKEAKTALEGVFSREDEARELVRKGLELRRAGGEGRTEGREIIIQALDLWLEIDGARCELGKMAISALDINEAIRWFEEELRLAATPREMDAHMYLAAIYRAQGDLASAETHGQEAMRTDTYVRQPVSLGPEEVRKIESAVRFPKR